MYVLNILYSYIYLKHMFFSTGIYYCYLGLCIPYIFLCGSKPESWYGSIYAGSGSTFYITDIIFDIVGVRIQRKRESFLEPDRAVLRVHHGHQSINHYSCRRRHRYQIHFNSLGYQSLLWGRKSSENQKRKEGKRRSILGKRRETDVLEKKKTFFYQIRGRG